MQFAASEFGNRFGEAADQPDRSSCANEFRRGCEHVITKQHGKVVAPQKASGSLAAPDIRVVDRVVVYQRRDVQQLYCYRHADHFFVWHRSPQLRCEQGHGRPHLLAGCRHHMRKTLVKRFEGIDTRRATLDLFDAQLSYDFNHSVKVLLDGSENILSGRRLDGCHGVLIIPFERSEFKQFLN